MSSTRSESYFLNRVIVGFSLRLSDITPSISRLLVHINFMCGPQLGGNSISYPIIVFCPPLFPMLLGFAGAAAIVETPSSILDHDCCGHVSPQIGYPLSK